MSTSTPESLSPDAVSELAATSSRAFETYWADKPHKDTDSLGACNEHQYYRMSQRFSDSLSVTDEEYSRLLANFEIHESFGPHSAEFTLLADPSPGDLLLHAFAIHYDSSYDELLDRVTISKDTPKYRHDKVEHTRLVEYHTENPTMFWRLVLTRNLYGVENLRQAAASTSQFLRNIDEEPEVYTDFDVDVDSLRAHNQDRLYRYQTELHMLDVLVRDGVKPLSPEEYYELMATYLTRLIRENEERLNPLHRNKDMPAMPGTIALQAFFENRANRSLPGIDD